MRHLMFLLPTLRGGGAERVVVTLLRHIDRRRFRLSLLVVDMSEAAYLNDIPADVELIDLKARRVLASLPSIFRILWSRRPDIVFSTLSHLNLALAVIRPLLPRGARFVARETSIVSEVIANYRRPTLWALAYRCFYRRFDLVVCQSRYMRDDLVGRYGYPAGKSVVINNPVDVRRIRELSETGGENPARRDPARIEFLAVGRLERVKGFDLLIGALALCRRPSMRLTIVGDGPLREELVKLAYDTGVAEQVTFAGFQENPYPFFLQCDAFVLSSRYEGFPNVVLEALACGTPVIAVPAIGGTVEILTDVPGCTLLADVSREALAAALDSFTRESRVPGDAVQPYEVASIVRQYEDALA
jgi:glycosyltransferase involved in cell wall biosynthesis